MSTQEKSRYIRCLEEDNIADQMQMKSYKHESIDTLFTLDQIKQMVDQGADPRDDDDRAFTLSCESYNNPDIPLYFLQLGANINADNGLALANAIGAKRLAIVSVLLEHGISITDAHLKVASVYYDKNIFSLLLTYITKIDDSMLKYIIKGNAVRKWVLINCDQSRTKTIIDNHLSLYEILLQQGIDPDTLCKHYLQENGIIVKEILRLFRQYHVDINKMIDETE